MSNFDVWRFNDLIAERGRPFKWERASRSTYYDPRTRSHLENSPDAGTMGYHYTDMTQPGVTYMATILGIMGDKKFAKAGVWVAGDAVMTFTASLSVGDRDRITLLDGVYRESDLLIRGTRDNLIDPNPLKILECRDSNRTYAEGVDFHIQSGGILWTGQQPAAGAAYSVIFEALPVYVVWMALPQIRAQVPTLLSDCTVAPAEMPRKVALRRWVDWVRAPGGPGE